MIEKLETKKGSIVNFRPMGMSDIDSVYNMIRNHRNEFTYLRTARSMMDYGYTKGEIGAWIESGDPLFVATYGKRLVGFTTTQFHDSKEAESTNLFVLKKWRRLGIGTILLKNVVEEVQKRGMPIIDTKVRIDKTDLIDLYEKVGFERGEDHAYLALRLPKK